MPDLSFSKIEALPMPVQNFREWQVYLSLIESYFRTRKIENPLVVEIGVYTNRQKRFYEELLDYRHIGIDTWPPSHADIIGNSKDSSTFNKLKEKLRGQPINLLFIDANHGYSDTKRNYELYSPLTTNIIVIHDVISYVGSTSRFWNELIVDRNPEMQDRTFITIGAWRSRTDDPDIQHGGTGTGIILIGKASERRYVGIRGEVLGTL